MAEREIKVNAKLIISLLSILVGIIFYISWGITYGVWADAGIYAVTVVFLAFGILGLIYTRIE